MIRGALSVRGGVIVAVVVVDSGGLNAMNCSHMRSICALVIVSADDKGSELFYICLND